MMWLVPASIIGVVGGLLDEAAGLHKVRCFLIGVGAFLCYVFVGAFITTIKIKRSK